MRASSLTRGNKAATKLAQMHITTEAMFFLQTAWSRNNLGFGRQLSKYNRTSADAHTVWNALLSAGFAQERSQQYEDASALAPNDPHSRNNIAGLLGHRLIASVRSTVAKAVEFRSAGRDGFR